ncbi:translation initiation factor IF-2 [Candidatus Kaiserbacteria bacterium RIFCSPHIGHO2_01_FULL_56_24]|uniref:Translation initiation factor IF-2 n=1 Tax=Candidatus Kaiserbacteria bacterium RIFCSPHIGHO2_01_FULL_56_24 TaxID=1798487 RepID=A0A1F6DFX2_9BACT|nr:MAG: translation initiation factor IF-2 [Candidatus Kaiserbacteria bacterium RIFCSPHIGHO2_01_FULL_56_24]
MKALSEQVERPPIVAVLGHVDHGKSTLLDYIRKTNTVAKEAGGITQHVAAYEVEHEREGVMKRITFIDTPGHAAFQAIRSRGAKIADIAILVVAADDGVKAQTLEALASILESKTPFVVAINKIDKPNADLSRTQGSLLEHHVYLEKFGGDVPWTAVSAKTGEGVGTLLDLILLVAEFAELKADAAAPAHGYVIEAHRDEKRGIAATLIITNGTLSSGMAVRAGRAIVPVRMMTNHAGKAIKEATFSSPVTLYGFDELPEVGSEFVTHKTKREAEAARPAEIRTTTMITSDAESTRFFLPVILRADVTGSLEGIMHETAKLGDAYTGLNIVHAGIGTISETDVKTAIASSAIPAVIIGFNVPVDTLAKESARQHGIQIETFDIIYKLQERLEQLLKERAPRRQVEEFLGKARVLKLFSSRKDTQTLGGSVANGKIEKNALVRIMRHAMEVGVGKVAGLQSHKQTVDRVETGGEFGAEITADFEIMQGDTLECFRVQTV